MVGTANSQQETAEQAPPGRGGQVVGGVPGRGTGGGFGIFCAFMVPE